MKHLIHALAAAVFISGLPLVTLQGQAPEKAAEQKPDPKRVKELMRRKLDHSQKLLEALALANLDTVAKHGEDLLRIAKEAEWKALNTKQYEMWSDDFRQSTAALVKAAKDKNLEGARLNYLGMTMGCFNCHSYVREQ
jgi:hypothetical protein